MKKESCELKECEETLSSHWNTNFHNKSIQNWVETEEPAILKWFHQMAIPKSATIFCAGVGDSNIVEQLINVGYHQIIANDISQVALDKLARNINHNVDVSFVVDNLVAPVQIPSYHGKVDVFIDRATLHFFTNNTDQDFYFTQLARLLKPNGYYMLGIFGPNNKPKCCGLDLQLWSEASIKNRLDDYQIRDSFEQAFEEQNGNIRNYIYTLAQKK